ncbi:MAG: hypothetical protein AAGE01_10635 [Pseudomonadota bacterium]
MFDLVILCHDHDGLNRNSNGVINYLARIFTSIGFKIGIQKGLGSPQSGRAVINLVDLTITPPDYVAYIDNFPVALNGRLLDISKTTVCAPETIVAPGDGYGGPVVVKTRRNFGGIPEQRSRGDRREPRAGASFDWRTITCLEPRNYQVFQSANQVPAGVWDNPELVVQRLYAEVDDAGSAIRTASPASRTPEASSTRSIRGSTGSSAHSPASTSATAR